MFVEQGVIISWLPNPHKQIKLCIYRQSKSWLYLGSVVSRNKICFPKVLKVWGLITN